MTLTWYRNGNGDVLYSREALSNAMGGSQSYSLLFWREVGGGIIAAHEQISISGNPELVGFAIAENAAADDDFVKDTFISGEPILTYDGQPAPPADWMDRTIRVYAWRNLP